MKNSTLALLSWFGAVLSWIAFMLSGRNWTIVINLISMIGFIVLFFIYYIRMAND